jgi:DNA (cytosine-5)-methyltransferase 1
MIGATFCSGIGAPEAAAPWVDWRFASEIEPFPRAVLAERFGYRDPDAQNQGEPLLWGDMQTVTPDLWRSHGLPLPELIVAGTPCQAFSVAGMRRGLDDDRGNLTLKFVEIVHDIVAARHDGQLVVLWENVPGVLSDKSNAFGCFLGAIVGAEQPITIAGSWPSAGMVGGPRARAAWIVRDAQYFGVAQRRRRVFVVIDFGNRVDPAQILFERQGLQGNSAPRRETGEEPAQTLDAGIGRRRGSGMNPNSLVVPSQDPAATLETTCNDYSRADGFNFVAEVPPLAFDCKGSEVQHDTVAPPLRAMGHAGSHTNGGGHAAVAIQERAVSENPDAGPDGKGIRDDDTAFTLEARTQPQAVAFKPSHYTRGKDGAPSQVFPPLTADADKGDQDPVIAFDLRGREGGGIARRAARYGQLARGLWRIVAQLCHGGSDCSPPDAGGMRPAAGLRRQSLSNHIPGSARSGRPPIQSIRQFNGRARGRVDLGPCPSRCRVGR